MKTNESQSRWSRMFSRKNKKAQKRAHKQRSRTRSMKVNAQTQLQYSAPWLHTVIELVHQGNYAEAMGMAQYFPATLPNRLAQFFALLGQEELERADPVAISLVGDILEVPNDFLKAMVPDEFEWHQISSEATTRGYCAVSYVCLETLHTIHPGVSILNSMLQCGSRALIDNNIDLGFRCLDRVLEFDGSPTRQILCAAAVLAGRRPETLDLLTNRANALLRQALAELAEDDIENRMKIANLWAVEERTLSQAFELWREVLQQAPVSRSRVSSALLPLLEYKPYFSQIADFLVEIDPTSIAAICMRLVQVHKTSNNPASIEKACQLLLETEPFITQDYADAMIVVGQVSGDFALFAHRLYGHRVPPDVSITVVRHLVETDPVEYALVEWFLEQILDEDLSYRTAVLQYWARLCEQSRTSTDRRAAYLARIVALSSGYREFIQNGVCGDLAQRLLTVSEAEILLRKAPWYADDVAESEIQALIGLARPSERRAAIHQVLQVGHSLPAHIRTPWLTWLFASDLEMGRKDMEALLLATESLPVDEQATFQSLARDNVLRECLQLVIRIDELVATLNAERRHLEILLNLVDDAIHRILHHMETETKSLTPDRQFLSLSHNALEGLNYDRKRISEHVVVFSRSEQQLSDFRSILSSMARGDTTPLELVGLLEQVRQEIRGIDRTRRTEIGVSQLETDLRRFLRSSEPTIDISVRQSLLRLFSGNRFMNFLEMHASFNMVVAQPIPAKFELAAVSEKTAVIAEANTSVQERHTRVDFPEHCLLERKVDLRIQLTREAPAQTRVTKAFQLELSSTESEVALDVHLTAPCFAVHKPHRTMVVPANGDSEVLVFTVIPVEAGDQAIEVEFFHAGSRLGYFLVSTVVQGFPTVRHSENVVVMEDPMSRLDRISQRALSSERRTIHVSWIERENRLCYTLYSTEPDEFGEWEHIAVGSQEHIQDDLRQLNALLAEVVSQGNPSPEDQESTHINCQALGKSLFKALVPQPFADQAKKWAPGSTILISTNEQWIPWELMHDGHDFWGHKFVLARYPRLCDRKRVTPSGQSRQAVRCSVKRIVNVVGGNVPEVEAKRAASLFAGLPSSISVTILQQQPISALVKALNEAEVLHLTCHGLLEPHRLQVASDRSRVNNLLPNTVQELPLGMGSMVFANACASAQPFVAFGTFGSFGWEFYRQGVDVFIGTLGPVPTKYAVAFAEAVYEKLIAQHGTVGEALLHARKEAAERNNLFWLLYCLFGDPEHSINIS